MKLYRITTAGLGVHYVVANGADEAYSTLRDEWNEANYGFTSDRELRTIELLAEERDFHNGRTVLRIAQDAALAAAGIVSGADARRLEEHMRINEEIARQRSLPREGAKT